MSTYRDDPRPRPKPVVIPMGRPLGGIIAVAASYLIVSFVLFFIVSEVTIECSRAAGTCRVRVVHSPAIATLDETLPLRSIEGAAVAFHVDRDGDTLEGIALVIDGNTVLLDGSSNVDHGGKEEWAREANAFFHDATAERLSLQRGSLWPMYPWALLAIGLAVFMLRAGTVFTIHKPDGYLEVVRRGVRTSTERFDLAQVAGVAVDEEVSDEGISLAIKVELKDGSAKLVTSHAIGDTRKLVAVERINQALADDAS
jgi:hypothetical protein